MVDLIECAVVSPATTGAFQRGYAWTGLPVWLGRRNEESVAVPGEFLGPVLVVLSEVGPLRGGGVRDERV